jgi:hypothetical protein
MKICIQKSTFLSKSRQIVFLKKKILNLWHDISFAISEVTKMWKLATKKNTMVT